MQANTFARNLLVGKYVARTASVTATNQSASTYAVDGEIVVIATGRGAVAAGTVLNTTTVVSEPAVVVMQSQGAGKPAIKSDIIERNKVINYKAAIGTYAQEQITYIGYDGYTSTNAIAVNNNTDYIGRILLQGEQNTFGNRDMYKQFDYFSSANDTQSGIAFGLQASLIANFFRMPDAYAKFEVVNSATYTVGTTNTGTITATVGSPVLTCSGSAASTDYPVGTYIRLDATANNTIVATTNVTAPVYIVIASTTTTITLNAPFQGNPGTSYTFTVANKAHAYATAATATAGNFGVKITGLPKSYAAGKFRYYKNRFKVLPLSNSFGTTPVTYTNATSTTTYGTLAPAQGANEGVGTTEELQDIEWLSQDGNIYRVSVPPFVERANVVNYLTAAGTNTVNQVVLPYAFSVVYIQYYDAAFGGVGQTQAARKELILAGITETPGTAGGVNTSFYASGTATSTVLVLDTWLSTGTNAPGFATQVGNV